MFYYYEHILRDTLREQAAQDRRLTSWGWFRRQENFPPATGWRFRTGEALIRLGSRLQGPGAAHQARTPGAT